MATFISILRGINVAGHNNIKMDALRELFGTLGFRNARTHIQSGNVIYQGKDVATEKVNATIQKTIKQKFGADVPVITLTLEELMKVVRSSPFTKDSKKDISFLHVTFLSDKPTAADVNKIEKNAFLPDEFVAIDKAIYLYCPGGYGKTRLSNMFFEKKLKVTATTRNWRVTNQLIDIAKEMAEKTEHK